MVYILMLALIYLVGKCFRWITRVLSGPWFNLRCFFLISLRLMIALHSWRISLKLCRRNRVLTLSQLPFHLYVMAFTSQEQFMILGRRPPTWRPWCKRPGLLPMRKKKLLCHNLRWVKGEIKLSPLFCSPEITLGPFGWSPQSKGGQGVVNTP